ncbi:hypothetical protein [Romeriopsis navalis]|uniref:hypothetical protein n=1 Tax=Romeriopsis navalis TaxID=2992132 RepID=UPI0021F82908|nr:hypothetical protein [Romeriopsis navalis]
MDGVGLDTAFTKESEPEGVDRPRQLMDGDDGSVIGFAQKVDALAPLWQFCGFEVLLEGGGKGGGDHPEKWQFGTSELLIGFAGAALEDIFEGEEFVAAVADFPFGDGVTEGFDQAVVSGDASEETEGLEDFVGGWKTMSIVRTSPVIWVSISTSPKSERSSFIHSLAKLSWMLRVMES